MGSSENPPRISYNIMRLTDIAKLPCTRPRKLTHPGMGSLAITCKSWKCPSCAARKLLKYYHRLKRRNWHTMVTLTFKENLQDPKKASKVWNRFRTRLMQLYRFDYARILEFQARGAIHYHVLIDRYIPHKSVTLLGAHSLPGIQDIWTQAGGGFAYSTRIQRSANSYAVKYLTKSAEHLPPKTRIFNFSRTVSIECRQAPEPPVAIGYEYDGEDESQAAGFIAACFQYFASFLGYFSPDAPDELAPAEALGGNDLSVMPSSKPYPLTLTVCS